MTDKVIWGIHAGSQGQADALFSEHNCIALGWSEMGNLNVLDATREAFKEKLAEKYPETKQGAVPVHGGLLFRFVHEMRVGDLVAYPCKATRTIHLGTITGDYRWDASLKPAYPHLRDVNWAREVPRTRFSQGALYEIGSAVSLFQLKNYADEFFAAFEGSDYEPPVDEDVTVAEVAEDIEETTRDFILKTLAKELKGHPFAHFIGHLLNSMGYRTRVSPEGPDGGIDIVAHRDELGFEPPIIKVQVKSSEGKIGDPEVSSLYGKVDANEHGLLVTLGSFTAPAINFARGKSNLRLIDGEELVELIQSHYESFDSRYKSVLPLKRVYVPESHRAIES